MELSHVAAVTKSFESHGAESCSCRAKIVFCVTSSTATHATTALSFSITCALDLERQPLNTLIRLILLAIRLDWIYYSVPVGYFQTKKVRARRKTQTR